MATKNISKKEVLHIAKLCNLVLSDEEVEKLSKMLTDTLDYIDILDEVDTGEVTETFQVTGLTNVYQQESDNPATLSKKEALLNAKEVIKGLFATKAVFDR
ncbi:MAG: Asp-tRNA(Asn)/Glu-tRNA(Gln) amidotransferase subunit GatC [Paludibacteraceae bacterium]|nr:Asp-tRNA(Asn)/Glu-tRNA(Gln) amidotransferase subunit GatC [Paludibacteraceae bacterium]